MLFKGDKFKDTTLMILLLIERSIEAIKSEKKISDEQVKELSKPIANAIYSGLMLLDEETQQADTYAQYLFSMIPPDSREPKLVREIERIIQRGGQNLAPNPKPNVQSQPPQQNIPPQFRGMGIPDNAKVVYIDMNSTDPAQLISQLAPMLEPMLKQFHESAPLQRFELIKDGSVTAIQLTFTKGAKLNVVAEFNKPANDWLTTYIDKEERVKTMTLQQGLQMLMLDPDMMKNL